MRKIKQYIIADAKIDWQKFNDRFGEIIPNGDYETITKEHSVKIRFYLQKTILDETSEEFYADVSHGNLDEITEMFEILNIIVEKINTAKKFAILSDSIFDIIRYKLYDFN